MSQVDSSMPLILMMFGWRSSSCLLLTIVLMHGVVALAALWFRVPEVAVAALTSMSLIATRARSIRKRARESRRKFAPDHRPAKEGMSQSR